MADFFTHFSCVLDVGTVDNAAKALDLYNVFMDELAAEDPPSDGFVLSIVPEYGGTKLWMHDETTGDPHQVVEFVLRCARSFRLRGRWGLIRPHVPGSAPSAVARICWTLAGAKRFHGRPPIAGWRSPWTEAIPKQEGRGNGLA